MDRDLFTGQRRRADLRSLLVAAAAAAVAFSVAPSARAESTRVTMPITKSAGAGPAFAGTVTRNTWADAASLLTAPGSIASTPLPALAPSVSPAFAAADGLQPAPVTVRGLGGFSLVIVPDAGLAANSAALAAFNRAAGQWASHIADPITVTVSAGLAPLPTGIIGSTSSVSLLAPYDTVRNQLVADAAGNVNKAILASLPAASGFSAFVPAGKTLDGNAYFTKADAKAVGFTGLDASFGASDGAITFSSNFTFDFNNADGVDADKVDFESVAAHEIGHLLGFISNTDNFDTGGASTGPTTLDLYRFKNLAANRPATAANFTSFARDLAPGDDDVTADTAVALRMSTGSILGDGWQASHWKADELSGSFVGIMDPTLANGVVERVNANDLRAMELIGYDVTAPEPSCALLLAALLPLNRRRR